MTPIFFTSPLETTVTFRGELPLFWDHGDGIHNISPPYGPWGSKFPSQWAVAGISGGDGFVD